MESLGTCFLFCYFITKRKGNNKQTHNLTTESANTGMHLQIFIKMRTAMQPAMKIISLRKILFFYYFHIRNLDRYVFSQFLTEIKFEEYISENTSCINILLMLSEQKLQKACEHIVA
jgi:tRNA U34 5-carboxymethylaminomethyl modifying enzyme MnmG/GidA